MMGDDLQMEINLVRLRMVPKNTSHNKWVMDHMDKHKKRQQVSNVQNQTLETLIMGLVKLEVPHKLQKDANCIISVALMANGGCLTLLHIG